MPTAKSSDRSDVPDIKMHDGSTVKSCHVIHVDIVIHLCDSLKLVRVIEIEIY
ncbi:hypothetical protein ACF0H5_014804 [Mactra antiquata]